MLNSYINANQTLAVNSNLEFDINQIQTGCTATHTPGTTSFQLNKPGFYFVTFNAVATATTTAATNPITIQLLNNGTNVSGALASGLSTAANSPINLSFSTLIQVKPSCCAVNNTAILTLQNTGIEAEYTNANIVITKLC